MSVNVVEFNAYKFFGNRNMSPEEYNNFITKATEDRTMPIQQIFKQRKDDVK